MHFTGAVWFAKSDSNHLMVLNTAPPPHLLVPALVPVLLMTHQGSREASRRNWVNMAFSTDGLMMMYSTTTLQATDFTQPHRKTMLL